MAANPIYIPTFIGSITYAPVRVLPHIYFYNGIKNTNTYFIGGYGATTASLNIVSQSAFPYFDNYSGNTPTTESLSLLFNNEAPVYGEAPTASLYTTYWEKYVSLLYNPRTRLFYCEGIIPLADYFKMELNDIVEWRGNYYHLRAINDYNLKNGECKLQLLGPILEDVITNLLPEKECNFTFTQVSAVPTTTIAPTTTTTLAPTTTTLSPTTTTLAPTTTTLSPTTTTLAPTTTTTTAGIIRNGLVYWNACDTYFGNTWLDKSGNNNSGSFLAGLPSGSSSQGVRFLGSSPSPLTYKNPLTNSPSSSWTMQMYGKIIVFVGFGPTQDLWCKTTPADGWDTSYRRGLSPAGQAFTFRDVVGVNKEMLVTGSIIDNQLRLITITADEATDTTKLYIDGQFIVASVSGGVNNFTASSNPLVFGFNSDTFGDGLNAEVRDILLYNRELSQAEISNNLIILASSSCAIPPPTTLAPTTTTIAPTTSTTTLATIPYRAVGCCDSASYFVGWAASGNPLNGTIYNTFVGQCMTIVEQVASRSVDFTITNANKGSLFYGYPPENQCQRCITLRPAPCPTTTTVAPTTTTTLTPTTSTTLAPTTTTTTISGSCSTWQITNSSPSIAGQVTYVPCGGAGYRDIFVPQSTTITLCVQAAQIQNVAGFASSSLTNLSTSCTSSLQNCISYTISNSGGTQYSYSGKNCSDCATQLFNINAGQSVVRCFVSGTFTTSFPTFVTATAGANCNVSGSGCPI